MAGALNLTQLGTPGSVGTAGVINVVNTYTPDSAFTNPAAMTYLQEDAFMSGVQVVIPEVKFDSSIAGKGGSDGGNAGTAAPIPSSFMVKKLSDDWRLGFSVTAPLGGGVDYGKNFVGRYSATRSVLAGVGISPSLAYRVNDKLSIGAGATFIYSKLDMDVAINQGPLPDGRASLNQLDDWGVQGFFGLTYQINEQAMIGVVYRSESETDLRGDLSIKSKLAPLNALDSVKVSWDYPQMVTLGLKFKLTDQLTVIADADWEDWSEFRNNYVSIQGGTFNSTIERNWNDTWHGGVAMLYAIDDYHNVSTGISYDSSPVEDKYRTADLPLDEQLKLSAAYGRKGLGNLDYSLALSYIYLGDAKMDQTVQGVRYKGEFDTNFVLFVAGTINYRF
jgi:long-chain fatty acid transport protein